MCEILSYKFKYLKKSISIKLYIKHFIILKVLFHIMCIIPLIPLINIFTFMQAKLVLPWIPSIIYLFFIQL